MMLLFEPVPDDEPLLWSSPLIRGVLKTATYIEEHSGIGLTKSGAFNREFVHWAAANFDWPSFSEVELFRVNKVLDEIDFPPLGDIRAVLSGLRFGRRYKGKFWLTKAGIELTDHPGRMLSELVPAYLFRLDHSAHLRVQVELMGNWDVFLNVINMEADHGCDVAHLRATLYGPPEADNRYDEMAANLFLMVVRPLCWAGLLQSNEADGKFRHAQLHKTQLWRRYLRLETDSYLDAPFLH